jgi:hypothetical protein
MFVTVGDDSILHDNPWGAVCARKWREASFFVSVQALFDIFRTLTQDKIKGT